MRTWLSSRFRRASSGDRRKLQLTDAPSFVARRGVVDEDGARRAPPHVLVRVLPFAIFVGCCIVLALSVRT